MISSLRLRFGIRCAFPYILRQALADDLLFRVYGVRFFMASMALVAYSWLLVASYGGS